MNNETPINVDGSPDLMGKAGQLLHAMRERAGKAVCLLDARMRTLTDDPMVAAKDADVVITDVWTSMGQEEERAAREKAFAGYCIDEKIMGVAKSDAIVQHCLPAHRGEEITEEVFEANAGPIFDEAENRLHAQKAVMATLMKD